MNGKVTLTFSVGWLVTMGAISAGLIAAFIFVPVRFQPLLTFSTAVMAGAALVTTVINDLDERITQGESARLSAALDFFTRWNAPDFFIAKTTGEL